MGLYNAWGTNGRPETRGGRYKEGEEGKKERKKRIRGKRSVRAGVAKGEKSIVQGGG